MPTSANARLELSRAQHASPRPLSSLSCFGHQPSLSSFQTACRTVRLLSSSLPPSLNTPPMCVPVACALCLYRAHALLPLPPRSLPLFSAAQVRSVSSPSPSVLISSSRDKSAIAWVKNGEGKWDVGRQWSDLGGFVGAVWGGQIAGESEFPCVQSCLLLASLGQMCWVKQGRGRREGHLVATRLGDRVISSVVGLQSRRRP